MVTRSVEEFELDSVLNVIIDPNYEFRHHEHSEAFQFRSAKHVGDLIDEFKHLGNPFIVVDDSHELIQLGTKDVAAVRNVEELGKRQQQEFRENRIIQRIVGVEDSIRKNKLKIFMSCNPQVQRK